MRKYQNKNYIIKLLAQLLRFGLVGFSNTAISLSIYYIFVHIDPQLYLIGNIIGFIASIINAYFWNSRFVFRVKKHSTRQFIRLFISYGTIFLLSTLFLYISVTYLRISEQIAPLLNLTLTIPLNFLINKLWVFKLDTSNNNMTKHKDIEIK